MKLSGQAQFKEEKDWNAFERSYVLQLMGQAHKFENIPISQFLDGHQPNCTAGEFHPTIVICYNAASGIGDNFSTWEHLCIRILGVLQLGLTGQPLVSLDIGGCARNATPKLLQFGGANDVKREASTIDVNFSGSLAFENSRLPYHHQITLQFGVLNCETALPRSRLRWRFDKKWAILTIEGFFSNDRGGCIISHDFIAVNFVSAAFD